MTGDLLAEAERACTSPVPGMTVMVFRARSTRKVRRAEMLPKSTNSVTYLVWESPVGAVSEPREWWDRNQGFSTPRMKIPKDFCGQGYHRGLGAGQAP